MKIIDEKGVRAQLDWDALNKALRTMFEDGAQVPLRHHHAIGSENGEGTLLLMPAWRSGGGLGVKVVNVFPGNSEKGLASVQGSYLLMSAETGELLCVIDGPELTARRTAAASVLAGEYLAPPNAKTYLIVGAGRIADNLLQAWSHAFDFDDVMIWNHNPDRARALARKYQGVIKTRAIDNLETAVHRADIISTATFSTLPLIKGASLKPGTHVDLVGSYSPEMRESDDEAMRRGSVFVDTREAAMKESGDLVLALKSGALKPQDIKADLFELVRGEVPGRKDEQELTIFKSVGTAVEDLAGAWALYQMIGENSSD
jgi:ornithine cyclodeaminase/alanine dehydrogenase-like protein (mu-crystallin family)